MCPGISLWTVQHQPRLAIFYGKLAVNVFQEMYGHLYVLTEELQASFLTAKAPVYRALAEVLITEGRLPEAQQVLDLLKTEEYLDFIRRDATDATALQGRAALTPEEATWAQRYAAITDRVAALGAERGTLRTLPTRTATEDARLAQLEADLAAATWAFQQFLTDLQKELGQTPMAQEKLFQLLETQGLVADLRDLGPGTVALYTLVGPTTSHVLLITPDVQLVRAVPITAADLSRKVLAFRVALEAVRRQATPPDPRPLAHELYTLLVAPIAADLRAVQARTLLWSLDGVLRYLPLAALYDGEHYLVESYALVIFTPASQPRWKDAPQPRWRVLGLGVSKEHAPFPALPGVVSELRGIIRDVAQGTTEGVLPGTIQLDEAFTNPAMLAALRQGYPVVHIASHFQLQPGDETASFLLLGDGSRLSLAQIKTWPTVFGGVDLLTLSACNTATGGTEADGKEVEGLSVLAQRQGAKAVIATLWPVEDTSTQALMQAFYQRRATQLGLSKAEALRQAQLQLLVGQGSRGTQSEPGRGLQLDPESMQAPEEPAPPFVPQPQAPYAHPYYWAPFMLMGNWR
jgi:CHAT domain-containing protein